MEVEVVGIGLPNVSIDDNERFARTVDTRHTTQAHGGAATKVTGVGNDVKTGNTTLQGFIDGGDGKTIEFLHVDALAGRRDFVERNLQACAFGAATGGDGDLADLRGIDHCHFIVCTVEVEGLRLISDEGDADTVLDVLHAEGEVSVDVGDGRCDDTVGGIDLNDVGHDDGSEVVADGSADDIARLLPPCIQAEEAQGTRN